MLSLGSRGGAKLLEGNVPRWVQVLIGSTVGSRFMEMKLTIRVHVLEMILESSCRKVSLADWTLHLDKMLL